MPSLIISVDRRSDIFEELIQESLTLAESIVGLQCRRLEVEVEDRGKYRDFIPAVEIQHQHNDALFVMVDELVDQFGWKVDIKSRSQ